MKKKASDATIEELLTDLTNFEDPDSSLVISTDGQGGVEIHSYDGGKWENGKTLRETLLNWGRWEADDPDWLQYQTLDWSENV